MFLHVIKNVMSFECSKCNLLIPIEKLFNHATSCENTSFDHDSDPFMSTQSMTGLSHLRDTIEH